MWATGANSSRASLRDGYAFQAERGSSLASSAHSMEVFSTVMTLYTSQLINSLEMLKLRLHNRQEQDAKKAHEEKERREQEEVKQPCMLIIGCVPGAEVLKVSFMLMIGCVPE